MGNQEDHPSRAAASPLGIRFVIENESAVRALAEAGAIAEDLAADQPWNESLQRLQELIAEAVAGLGAIDGEPEGNLEATDQ